MNRDIHYIRIISRVRTSPWRTEGPGALGMLPLDTSYHVLFRVNEIRSQSHKALVSVVVNALNSLEQAVLSLNDA